EPAFPFSKELTMQPYSNFVVRALSRAGGTSSPRRAAMTLIELVVVMVVLTTLAALVIPKLGFIQQESVNVSGVAASSDLASNLETYKVSTGYYPLRFDSLLASGAAGLSPSLWAAPGGFPPTPYVLNTTWDNDPATVGSFGGAFGPGNANGGGTYYIMDQDAGYAGEDVNQSFNTGRAFTFSGDAVATVTQANTQGQMIWQAAGFPSTTPFSVSPTAGTSGTYTPPATATGVTLVALGVGPQCSAVGQTMTSAPQQVSQQTAVYGRYVAIFATYGTGSASPGRAAELKLVVDSYYQTVASNIAMYKQGGPVNQ
ncbi:MAG TPA: hypothetical protein VHV55_18805, partial [Pirellulales bacterium]|nr:hypothetical protein [Pirellulales bacterium]